MNKTEQEKRNTYKEGLDSDTTFTQQEIQKNVPPTGQQQ